MFDGLAGDINISWKIELEGYAKTQRRMMKVPIRKGKIGISPIIVS